VQNFHSRSRIATCGRLFEGTDLNSPGQTSTSHVRNRYRFVARSDGIPHDFVTVVPLATWQADTPKNLKAMLPNGWRTNRKLVSFCQCRCTTAQDTKSERSRRYEPTDVPVTSLSARASCMQNTSTTAFSYFVHSLWITMWTDCRRFIEPPVRRLRGGSSR